MNKIINKRKKLINTWNKFKNGRIHNIINFDHINANYNDIDDFLWESRMYKVLYGSKEGLIYSIFPKGKAEKNDERIIKKHIPDDFVDNVLIFYKKNKSVLKLRNNHRSIFRKNMSKESFKSMELAIRKKHYNQKSNGFIALPIFLERILVENEIKDKILFKQSDFILPDTCIFCKESYYSLILKDWNSFLPYGIYVEDLKLCGTCLNKNHLSSLSGEDPDILVSEKIKFTKKEKEELLTIKKCFYCGDKFYTVFGCKYINYFPKKITSKNIKYCTYCMRSVIYGEYKEVKNRKEMISDLRTLIKVLGYIPDQQFRRSKFYRNLSIKEFNKLIPILINLAPYDYEDKTEHFAPLEYMNCTYKKQFGSWFEALISAKILKGDIWKIGIGTYCLAKDGHKCRSIAEKNIDDWFYSNNILHEIEPKYPKDKELNNKKGLRADWKVKGVFIEYFGLRGNEEYDIKTERKRDICKKYNIKLIELFYEDVQNLNKKLDIFLK